MRKGLSTGAKALACLGLVTAMSPMAVTALAYFTDSTEAEGGFALRLSPDVEIRETYGRRQKHVVIANADGSVPVWVRARAFSSLTLAYSGEGWEDGGDGWFYHASPVEAGSETSPLDVSIEFPRERTETVTEVNGMQTTVVTSAPETGDEHDVEVVYECVPVTYGDDGKPLPAAWGR